MTEEKKQRPFIEPGWHRDLSNEDYHKSNGLSSTDLKRRATMNDIEAAHDKANHKQTESKTLGSVLHCLILNPHDYSGEYMVKPTLLRKPSKTQYGAEDKTDKTLKQIEDWDNWIKKLGKKTQITPETEDKANLMKRAILRNDVAAYLIENSVNESSAYVNYNGFNLKAKTDSLFGYAGIISDIKTGEDISYSGFQKSIEKWGYHVSASTYLEVVNNCPEIKEALKQDYFGRFEHICVKNKEPYYCQTYTLSDDYLSRGFEIFQRLLFKQVKTLDNDGQSRVMEPPTYATREWIV